MLIFLQCFEKWGELSGSSSAQLADLYPVLQKLPAIIAPNVKYAKKLHEVEKKLYVGHWMRAKNALDNGTGLVCTPKYPFLIYPTTCCLSLVN